MNTVVADNANLSKRTSAVSNITTYPVYSEAFIFFHYTCARPSLAARSRYISILLKMCVWERTWAQGTKTPTHCHSNSFLKHHFWNTQNRNQWFLPVALLLLRRSLTYWPSGCNETIKSNNRKMKAYCHTHTNLPRDSYKLPALVQKI